MNENIIILINGFENKKRIPYERGKERARDIYLFILVTSYIHTSHRWTHIHTHTAQNNSKKNRLYLPFSDYRNHAIFINADTTANAWRKKNHTTQWKEKEKKYPLMCSTHKHTLTHKIITLICQLLIYELIITATEKNCTRRTKGYKKRARRKKGTNKGAREREREHEKLFTFKLFHCRQRSCCVLLNLMDWDYWEWQIYTALMNLITTTATKQRREKNVLK